MKVRNILYFLEFSY